MANYPYTYQQSFNQIPNQLGQLQQMFPQPQGSIYSINSPLEIGNVPIGSTGLSVALCLNEGLMYIKSFQNGNPVIMTYHILPHTTDQKPTSPALEVKNDSTEQTTLNSDQIAKLNKIDDLINRLTRLENSMGVGGKINELLQP